MDVLASFATASTLGYFLSSTLQARTIIRNKGVGEISFYPFAATYLNCMLWFKYGIFTGDPAVTIVNGVGALIAILIMIVYYLYSHEKEEVERKVLQVLTVLFMIFLTVRIGLIPPSWIGFLAMVASVTMFAAPLVTLKNIIRKHDSSLLSLPTISMTLVVASSWTIYGFTKQNIFIIVPNLLGGLIGICQLLILLKYRSPNVCKVYGKDRSSYEQLDAILPRP